MKKLLALLFATAAMANAAHAAGAARPDWAYAIPGPVDAAPPVRDDGKLLSLPGTDRKFTLNKIRGRRDNDTPVRVAPADWYPGDHPAMPKIVAEGDNARGIVACGLCHYPDGKGRSENAGPAGLSAAYLVRQLHDMRDDLRQSSEDRKANAQQMVGFAKAMTEPEIQAAARYFASMSWTPWIKVVETRMVPKTRSAGGLVLPLTGSKAGSEPIGARIVETPVNPERTEILRDPRSGFIAYVPVGSIAKGGHIVTTGDNGKTLACAICHGEKLDGIGPIPGIAARSPSYLARQLYDIQQGARHGAMTALMKPVVAKLSAEDIIDIAAYTASLPVAPAAHDEMISK